MMTTGGGVICCWGILKILLPNGPEAQPARNRHDAAMTARQFVAMFLLFVFIVIFVSSKAGIGC